MSTVAVFQMFCCRRLFVWGRFEGKTDSTSGVFPQAWCWICDPQRVLMPKRHEKKSTCEFVGYTFDDRLDRPLMPLSIGKVRFLTQTELNNFVENDPTARQKMKENPPKIDTLPK